MIGGVARVAGVDQVGSSACWRNAACAGGSGFGELREEYGCRAGTGGRFLIDYGNIRIIVAIECAGCQRSRSDTGVQSRLRGECPVSFPQEYGYVVRTAVGDGKVRDTVPIEVSNGDGLWARAGARAGRRGEVAGAVAEQNRDVVLCAVGDG